MRRRMHPTDALVAAQVVAAAGLLWPGRPRWPLPRAVQIGAAGAVLGGATLATAGVRAIGPDLTPFVDPPTDATLHTRGGYALSRNPIYGGILLGVTGYAVLRRRPEPAAAAAALSVVLRVKTGVEESRLRRRFGAQYVDYAARTPRLLGVPGRSRRRGVSERS